MDSRQFIQVIPRLRVFETRLLDKAKIDRMIESSSAEEAIKTLIETEYSNLMSNECKAEDYEEVLSSELKRVYHDMYDMIHSKELVDLFSIKYDYHNIKVILKGRFLNRDLSDILVLASRMDALKLKSIIDNNELADLNSIMRKGIEETLDDYANKKDPQRIDIILDKYMYQELKLITSLIDNKFINNYIEALIDLTNIKTLLRVKKQNKGREFLLSVVIDGGKIDKDMLLMLINEAPENIPNKLSYTDYCNVLKVGVEDYNKTSSASLLEKLVDNYIMDMMKDAKMIPFGPEAVIAYIYAKETEIKVIRTIMVGKLNNITQEVIRERLRDVYV